MFSFKSAWRVQKRVFNLTTGEKAPFWVTVFFWARADGGEILPPGVIHMSGRKDADGDLLGTGDMFECIFGDSLPEDWIMHWTESGYADKYFFEKMVSQLVAHHKGKGPCVALIDGHEPHENAEIMKQAAEVGVYFFFLKSHDNTRDQIADCGPNACIKKIYCKAMEQVKSRLPPGTAITVPIVNEALADLVRRPHRAAKSHSKRSAQEWLGPSQARW